MALWVKTWTTTSTAVQRCLLAKYPNQTIVQELWKALNNRATKKYQVQSRLHCLDKVASVAKDMVCRTKQLGVSSSSLLAQQRTCIVPRLVLYRDNWLLEGGMSGVLPFLDKTLVGYTHCNQTNYSHNSNYSTFSSTNNSSYWYLHWKHLLFKRWSHWKKVWKTRRNSLQSLLLTSSIGLAATIASDVEPKRTDTGEKVSYGPHSSALLNAAARHGAGSAPPHETGIGLIPGRILKWVGWSLAQLVGIGLIWLMVHHPSSTGVVALIGLLLFATNPGEASFLQWIKTQAPILARHKEAKIDKLRVRIAPYLFNLQDWKLWNCGICTIIHVRDFADYVYIYLGILGRWILLGWWKDPEFVFE
ncbi:hypothetical protein GAYE_SCF16G3671 [Galdieria yellowstonensis]|uniref:Uncharacterized protein n=1 Tax=Galdieria yellowstonensis TaxID=3028027 RepID=A0AAV9IE98_9RHOD|nr:hypothetical protein GAYE_SCF16G3671 [Galdieria yellowstonensis]